MTAVGLIRLFDVAERLADQRAGLAIDLSGFGMSFSTACVYLASEKYGGMEVCEVTFLNRSVEELMTQGFCREQSS